MVNLVKIVFLTSAFSSLRQEVQIRIQFSSLQFSSCRFLSNSYSKFFSTTKSGLRPLFIVSKKRNQKHFLLNSYSKFLLWTSYRVLFSKNSTEKVFSISYSPIRRRKLHQILTRFSVFFSEKENDERDENAMLESDLSGDFSAVWLNWMNSHCARKICWVIWVPWPLGTV